MKIYKKLDSGEAVGQKGANATLMKKKSRTQISKDAESVFMQAVTAGLQRKIIDNPEFTYEKWKSLMQLSVKQSLLPVVFEAVYPLLPEDLEREYRTATVAWITDQVQRTNAFLLLYRELLNEGIEPLVIKGIICRDTYALPEWRVSSDEDIYIPRYNYPHFHEVMCRLGFQSSPPNFESEHETIYKSAELVVEGHWLLFPQETHQWEQVNKLGDDIVQRAQYVTIDGVKMLTPEPTDHMIYLLLHAMKHFTLSGIGIRQICDIAMWDKKYTIDWYQVKKSMDIFGGTKFASAILDAANRYFEMDVPDGWEYVDSSALIQDALKGGTFGHSSEDRMHSASITVSSGGKKSGLIDILRSIFPNRKVMEINYPWVRRSPLYLFLGWFVRLIRYADDIRKGASPLHSIKIGRRRAKLLQEYNVFNKNH